MRETYVAFRGLRRYSALVVLLAGVLGCRHASPEPARPLPASPDHAAKVVLISYDGTSADEMAAFESEGIFSHSGFLKLAAEGYSAERVVPVNPTLTSSTHIAIVTGATPEKSGIVSNWLHTPGTPPDDETSGFAAPIQVETLWEAAKRQGKIVGTITYPGLDGNGPGRTADWGLIYTEPVVPSKIVSLGRRDFTDEWVPDGWSRRMDARSFSPLRKARIVWALHVAGKDWSVPVTLVALDTTDDHRENYDRIEVELPNGPAAQDPGGWFPVSREVAEKGSSYLYGSWSKVISFDPQLSRVVVYQGPISRTLGYPDSYRQMIDREVGFWPGPPDSRFAAAWLANRSGIEPEIFVQQLQRFSDFFTRATLVSMQKMEFDLLLGYQPIVDEAEHQFRIENDQQEFSTAENRRAGREVRIAAYRKFDQSLAEISSSLPVGGALVVTGDHGLAPTDTTVQMNRLLVKWGYGSSEPDGRRLDGDRGWKAITSGNVAEIYGFNGEPTRSGAELVSKLKALRSPDGAPVFEKVERKGAGSNANAGDIVAVAWPRFSLSPSVSGEVFVKTTHYGTHGGLNHHPEFHTIFAAWGQGVTPGRTPSMQQTEIARFVSELLGIDPPAAAQ
ncbi:MAG: alkaline phosphatase family protein [Thermoanaerobaculia bacterium]